MNLQFIFNQEIQTNKGHGLELVKAIKAYCRQLRDTTQDVSLKEELTSLRIDINQAPMFSQELSENLTNLVLDNLEKLNPILELEKHKRELERVKETGEMPQEQKIEHYRKMSEERNEQIKNYLENEFGI